MAVTSSIGPGALNMVTAAGTATVNHIPALFLPGDVFADRQPDPVLQRLEVPHDYTISANDAFKPVSRYFDRITRPEQIMTALIHAMSVLTDPAQAGAVTIALPQDVQGEAYDYPVEFFEKRVHHIERRPPTMAQVSRIVDLIKAAQKPYIICGGGVRYSEAGRALADFCKRFGIPFGETQAGKGCIPWDHPCNLSGIGVTGSLAANRLAKGSRPHNWRGNEIWRFYHLFEVALPESFCKIRFYQCFAFRRLQDECRADHSRCKAHIAGCWSQAWHCGLSSTMGRGNNRSSGKLEARGRCSLQSGRPKGLESNSCHRRAQRCPTSQECDRSFGLRLDS